MTEVNPACDSLPTKVGKPASRHTQAALRATVLSGYGFLGKVGHTFSATQSLSERGHMRETQMIADQKTANSERLNWNAGGWFGAQIGGTCWIVICAALLIAHDLGLAKILFAMFMATNLVGSSMWFFRNRITAYRAMQILLIMTGVAGLAATFAIDRSGLWSTLR